MTLNTLGVGGNGAGRHIRGCAGFLLVDDVDAGNWECTDRGLVRNRWAWSCGCRCGHFGYLHQRMDKKILFVFATREREDQPESLSLCYFPDRHQFHEGAL